MMSASYIIYAECRKMEDNELERLCLWSIYSTTAGAVSKDFGKAVSGLGFEPRASKMQRRDANHYIVIVSLKI
jgi:hypothetical protein